MYFISLGCSLLLLFSSCRSTLPLQLNRGNDLQFGQKEYFPNSEEYDTHNADNKQQQQQQPQSQLEGPLEQAEQFAAFLDHYQPPRPILSQFPSLTRPEGERITFEGQNRLSKYKHFRPQQQSAPAEVELESAQDVNPLRRLVLVPQDYSNVRPYYYRNSLGNQEGEAYGVDGGGGGGERKKVQDDGIVSVDHVDRIDEAKSVPQPDLSMVWAMKKALQHEKMTNRHPIDEKVLESAMVEQPKRRREAATSLDGPAVAKLTGGDDHYYARAGPYHQVFDSNYKSNKLSFLGSISDFYFIVIVACVSSIAIFSVIGAGYCFYKVQQQSKAASELDFPSYGIVGPACSRPGSVTPPKDRQVPANAQMYHYQNQKQQMISNEKNNNIPKHPIGSDIESDEENEDGEYTVYECPGLAPTGEMEVKNPMFQDDLTPMDSPSNKKDKK